MAEILKGARKYRLGLTLAHQELHQLRSDQKVESAVATHPCTRIVFRVGDDDAKRLAESFSSFDAQSLKNLPKFHAIARVEQSDCDFNLTIRPPEKLDDEHCEQRRQEVKTASREKYARPRAEIEAALRAKLERAMPEPERPKPKPPCQPVPYVEEVPKPADPVPVTATKHVEKAAPIVREPPRDLGRGGEQHKTIQERIQAEARKLGFLAEIERQLPGKTTEAADLILRQDAIAIAVEISITTTVDHEFGNVKKCLASGFSRVAVVSPSTEKLRAIAEAVQAGLGSEAAATVGYHTPDQFIAEMRTWAAGAKATPIPPSVPAEHTTLGYKVKRHGPTLTPEERAQHEETAIRIIAEAMRRPEKKD
jgi:hypothetical protein